MVHGRPGRIWVAGIAVLGLTLSACASSGAATYGGSGGTGGASGTVVKAGSVSGLGTVLESSNGAVLYLLTADRGGTPTCTASACTAVWPPLLLPSGASAPKADSGVTASMLGTVKTPGGRLQVTYDHWPLYLYAGDSGPGVANGEGIKAFGGTWYAVTSSGAAAKKSSSGSGGASPSPSSGAGW